MTGLVLFLVMEGLWIGALAVLADGLVTGVARLEAALVVLAYPVALVLARPISRIRRLPWWLALQGLAFTIVAAILIILLVPGFAPSGMGAQGAWDWFIGDADAQRALFLLVVALFAWTRGVMLAGHRVDAQAVALGFQIGLAALVIVQIWAYAVDLALPGAVAVNIGFVCAALLSLWHVRAAKRSGVASPVLAISLVLACAGLASLVLNPGILAMMLDLLAAAWRVLRDAVLALFALLPEPDHRSADFPPPTGGAMPEAGAQPQAMFQPIAWLRMLVTILFVGGMVLIVGTILVANLRGLLAWLRRRLNETPGIAHDRSKRSLGDTLRTIWRELSELLARTVSKAMRELRAMLTFSRDADVIERRRYRTLLRGLDMRGWPRHPHETPAEYAQRMRNDVWPGPGGDLVTMSKAYAASRYGGVRPEENRFARLWQKTRRSLRKVTSKQ